MHRINPVILTLALGFLSFIFALMASDDHGLGIWSALVSIATGVLATVGVAILLIQAVMSKEND